MADMLRVFKSLSDRTRLRIVRLLLERDLCVCELMFVLGMAQSRISHQLRILRDAGLVEDTRDGQWIIYRIPLERPGDDHSPSGALPRESPRIDGRGDADAKEIEACLKKESGRKSSGRNRPGDASKPEQEGDYGH